MTPKKVYYFKVKRYPSDNFFLDCVKAHNKKEAKRTIREKRPQYYKYKFLSNSKYNRLKNKGYLTVEK